VLRPQDTTGVHIKCPQLAAMVNQLQLCGLPCAPTGATPTTRPP
jgi:hypothetical protein